VQVRRRQLLIFGSITSKRASRKRMIEV